MAVMILTACGGDDEAGGEASQDVATRIPNVEGAPALTPFVEGGTPVGGAGAAGPAGAASPAPDAAPAAASSIEIIGFDIGWTFNGQSTTPGNPITVTAAPGATVSLPNEGAALHNFSVDAFGISIDMPAGETVEAQIPADAAPGEYEFY
ncbi:MAG: cupredoxin domain-containing protein, partial [Chloroflexota bacterium]|nr:cupredoxin domain-containing protein [Chloroflexota bacterium]